MNRSPHEGRRTAPALVASLCAWLAACSTPPHASSTTPPSEPHHRIVLQRPARVGERFELHARVDQTRTTEARPEGQPEERLVDARSLEIEADAEVVAVDDAGRAVRTEYVVRRLDATLSGETASVLPSGTRVVVELSSEGPGRHLVDGTPAADALAPVLAAILPAPVLGASDDAIFGTDTPQPIGGQWPVDREALARALSTTGRVTFAPEAVSGEATLVGVVEIDGVRCLDVAVEVSIAPVSLGGLAEGSMVTSSGVRFSMRGAFPIDPSSRRPTERSRVELHFDARSTEGERRTEVRFRDVKERVAVMRPLR